MQAKLFILLAFISLFGCAKQPMPDLKHLNVTIMPQPETKQLKQLATTDIKTVISFRTAEETKSLAFNEAQILQQQGINFYNIEIGENHPYSLQKLIRFNQIMEQNKGQKIIIHCRSGNRAAQVYAAWLLRYQGLSKRQMKQQIKPYKAKKQAIKQLNKEHPNS